MMTDQWTKSSRCDSGSCVEVRSWTTSSRCSSMGTCVEVASDHLGVAMRDSKHPDGPEVVFDLDAWRSFIDWVKAN